MEKTIYIGGYSVSYDKENEGFKRVFNKYKNYWHLTDGSLYDFIKLVFYQTIITKRINEKILSDYGIIIIKKNESRNTI